MLALGVVAAAALLSGGNESFRADFDAYRAAVQTALAGASLYPSDLDAEALARENPWVHPPSALLVLWPLGVLPVAVASVGCSPHPRWRWSRPSDSPSSG